MEKGIHCEKCLREIEVRNDLVTTTSWFKVVPYHEECFTKELKSVNTLFVDNQPINGFSGSFIQLLSGLFFIGTTIYSFSSGTPYYLLLSIMFLIPIICRAYSYFSIERYIEK